MLKFWLKAGWVLGSKSFAKPINMEQDFVRHFRVGLFDCEALRLMSAFRYARYLDFMRWEFVVRSPLFNELLSRKAFMGLGCQKIIHRKPLKLFARFSIITRMEGWDNKWVYPSQHFVHDGQLMALCVSRSAIQHRGKPLGLGEIAFQIGLSAAQRQAAPWVLAVFEQDTTALAEASQAVPSPRSLPN